MSLCRSALLLSVVLVSCALLLPTTGGVRKSYHDVDDKTGVHKVMKKSDLISLLKEVQERLRTDEVDQPLRSVHDNVNEKRWRDVDSESSRSDSGLTEDQATQLVNAINNKRRAEGASDMNHIRWNAKVAELAQFWSDECRFAHGTKPHNSDVTGLLTLGTNLWAFEGPFNADSIVNNWYNDKANFNPKTQQCYLNQPCGAYKQLVTAETTDVGCAMSFCSSVAGQSNLNFIVCYFGPAGNYENEKAFLPGPACTECATGQFYCNNGLCDPSCTSPGAYCECKADCKNCGTVTSDCFCKCKPGSTGVSCGYECKDFNAKCHRFIDGWWPEMCNSAFSYVLNECPKMCGLCQEGNPCGREDEPMIALEDE
jgi:hypothetical protein